MTYSDLWMSIVSGVSMGGIFIYLLLNHTSSETYNININHCCAKENCLVETVYDEEDEEEVVEEDEEEVVEDVVEDVDSQAVDDEETEVGEALELDRENEVVEDEEEEQE